jgi:RecA-family ATPase
VASGLEWCGKRTKAGAVVYLCGEGYEGVKRRLEALRISGYPVHESPIYILPHSADLYSGDNDELIKAMQGIPSISCVIIDTLHANTPGLEENSNTDMGKAIDKIRALKRAVGNPSIVIVHHTGWDSDRSRGASSLKAAVDTEFFLKKDEAGNITLTQAKNKDGADAAPMGFEIESVPLGIFDEYGVEVTSAIMIQSDGQAIRFTENSKVLYDAIGDVSA